MARTATRLDLRTGLVGLTAAFLCSHAASTFAQDLHFNQQQADRDSTIRQLTWDTRVCMADASKAMLRMGNRDSSQIVLFAKKVCGNALTTYLSGQGRLSAKDADAFIEALAYDQLSGIPGVQYRPAAEAQKNEKDGYVVAVGAFANPAPVVAQLKSEGIPHYTESSGALVRVKAGPFVSKEAAESARVKLGALGFKPGDTKVSSNATKD